VWKQEAISNCEGTTFEKNGLRRLKAKSRVIEPTIWIGRGGISQQQIQHVQKQLDSHELVKLKLQKSALSSETTNIAEKISDATGSILVDIMGHTFTLYKKKREDTKAPRQGSTR